MNQSIRSFPSTLNGYELGRELGKGAFGKVFQAHVKDDVTKVEGGHQNSKFFIDEAMLDLQRSNQKKGHGREGEE